MNTGVAASLEIGGHRFGESPVDGLIRRPVFRAEHRLDVNHVAQRPQAFVREAAVVAPLFFLAEPDAVEIVGGSVGRNAHAIVVVADLAIGVAGAVRDPRAAALAHQRVERDRHAAGRRNGDDRSVLSRLMKIGLPVGNDNEHP